MTARTPKLAPGYVSADFQGQPAKPCADAGGNETVTFRIEPDTPQPACWKMQHFVAVRIVNGTGDYHQPPRVISGGLSGAGSFRLQPGASTLLRLRGYFGQGDHCVKVNVYHGSCLALWVTAPDPGS